MHLNLPFLLAALPLLTLAIPVQIEAPPATATAIVLQSTSVELPVAPAALPVAVIGRAVSELTTANLNTLLKAGYSYTRLEGLSPEEYKAVLIKYGILPAARALQEKRQVPGLSFEQLLKLITLGYDIPGLQALSPKELSDLLTKFGLGGLGGLQNPEKRDVPGLNQATLDALLNLGYSEAFLKALSPENLLALVKLSGLGLLGRSTEQRRDVPGFDQATLDALLNFGLSEAVLKSLSPENLLALIELLGLGLFGRSAGEELHVSR